MKAHLNNSGWLFGQLLGSCIGEVDGLRRAQLLHHLAPSFTFKRSRNYIELLEKNARAVLDDLQPGFMQGALLHPARDLRNAAFYAVAETIFGTLTPQQASTLLGLVTVRERLLMKAFTGTITRFSWSRYLPSTTNRELTWFQHEFESLVFSLVKRDTARSTPARALVEAVHRGEIPKVEAIQTLDEILFANLDVMAGAIAWAVVLVAEDAHIQNLLRNEFSEIRRDGKSWEDYIADADTLLAAAVRESGRVRPLASFSVPQAAPTDRIVGGYRIPKGTDFIVDSRALNVLHPVWGGDGEFYRPGRWLGHFKSGRDRDLRYQFWRYGFGPRQCLGKYVGDMMLRVFLVELLDRYQLTLDPRFCDTQTRDPNNWIATPVAQVKCTRIRTKD